MRTLLLFLALTSTALAHKTAQESAEASARSGLAHRGGNPCYEGISCSSTPEGAFRSCCYASSSNLITYDVGIAQSKNGMWCCTRRYVSKSMIGRIPELLRRAGLKRQRSTLADCWVTDDEEETVKQEEE